MIRLLIATGGLALGAALVAPVASADQFGPNCQTDNVRRGILGLSFQTRTICDTPIRSDGSWSRKRIYWIPAHHVSAQSNCTSSTYSSHCTFTDAYDVDDTIVDGPDEYVVFPDNVLPDEPGHMPV
ncbi:hypothetical protein TUM20984_50650 [Mycobacterium antarcticum]|nr:hypothetical protein TUM20984_50650 [Mycolicibacterium sp. TUM20984]